MSRLTDYLQTNLALTGDQRLEIGLDIRHLRDDPGHLGKLLDPESSWLRSTGNRSDSASGEEGPAGPGTDKQDPTGDATDKQDTTHPATTDGQDPAGPAADEEGSADPAVGTAGGDDSALAEEDSLQEALCSAAYGLGLLVTTRSRAARGKLVRSVAGPSRPVFDPPETASGLRVFRGGAVPNPSFVYAGRAIMEGLVVIDARPVIPTTAHGIHIRRVMEIISNIAYHTLRAPIIMIQSPAQVPTRGGSTKTSSQGKDRWPRSYSIAVRFAIAVGDLSARERKLALAPLIAYCESERLSLALLDPRPSHRAGNWFWLIEDARKDWPAGGSNPAELHFGYPLTFVGPARIGATAAILRCLNEFPELSIIAASSTSLADLAFVTLWIGLTRTQRNVLSSDWDRWHDLQQLEQKEEAYPALTSVLSALGYAHEVTDESHNLLSDRAFDYAACHGPILKTNYNSIGASRCLWFSIEGVQSRYGLRDALSTLNAATTAILEPAEARLGGAKLPDGRQVRLANLDYLITRVNSAGGLRARGKLSIPDLTIEALTWTMPPDTTHDERATLFSRRLEEEWNAQLSSRAAFDISVAWRENWLGHWGRSSHRDRRPSLPYGL